MPAYSRIDRLYCFSLTDFHDFDYCQFRFFVKHHLNKKYEIEDSNYNMALGTVLDQAIKIFHDTKAYGCPVTYLPNLVKAAERFIKDKVATTTGPSFYSAIIPFLDETLLIHASEVFQTYYRRLNGTIKRSLGSVGFCDCIVKTSTTECKLWGGPDTYELGEDGLPEVCDYKLRAEGAKGKSSLDMDLMPKIYTMLAARYLVTKGYTRARFLVRLWLNPGDDSLWEEFDLTQLVTYEEVFAARIEKILQTKDFTFCEKPFCAACKSDKRKEFITDLAKIHKIMAEQPQTDNSAAYGRLPF